MELGAWPFVALVDGGSGQLRVHEQVYFQDFTNPLMGSSVPLCHTL